MKESSLCRSAPSRSVGPRRLTANPARERGIVERKAEMLISRWVSQGYLRTTESSIFTCAVGPSVSALKSPHTRTPEAHKGVSAGVCVFKYVCLDCVRGTTTRGTTLQRVAQILSDRASPFTPSPYLPNDISARNSLFCGDADRLPTVRDNAALGLI